MILIAVCAGIVGGWAGCQFRLWTERKAQQRRSLITSRMILQRDRQGRTDTRAFVDALKRAAVAPLVTDRPKEGAS